MRQFVSTPLSWARASIGRPQWMHLKRLCSWEEGARPNKDADFAVPPRGGGSRVADAQGHHVRV